MKDMYTAPYVTTASHAPMHAPAPRRNGRRSWAVGDRAHFETLIDESLIDRFADLTGDHHPLHTDEEYAARTPFRGRIAHGMIAGALFSRLVGEHLPGERALYRSQALHFVTPLHPGTRVRVEGEVTAYDPELSLLTLRTSVSEAGGTAVFVEGTAEVLLRKPDENHAPEAGTPATAATHGMAATSAGLCAGKRALVIGGSRGIGAAIAWELAHAGAAVAIGYYQGESRARGLAERIHAEGGRAAPVPLDLASAESVTRAVHAAAGAVGGDIDTLVLSGYGRIDSRGIERIELAHLTNAFERAVGGLYHAVRAVLPGMRARGNGSIIVIGSTVTLEPPPPSWTAYTVAKSALVGFARSLAVELGPHGIRVNVVSPSLTETEETLAQPPRIRDELAARSPLGRLARPADVARAVVFLASDQASYLTGLELPVAGGAIA